MKKYLVDVYLPTCESHYDAFIPAGKQIGEVIRLLGNIMTSLSEGMFVLTPDTILFDGETGKALPVDVTAYDAGIRNASKLILI